MASTHIYYKVTYPDGKSNLQLCFECAIILAVDKHDHGVIRLDTTDYRYTKCDHCDEFIYDKNLHLTYRRPN